MISLVTALCLLPALADPALDITVRVVPETQTAEITVRISGLDAQQPQLELSMAESYAFTRLAAPLLAGEVQASASGPLELERHSPYSWTLAKGAAESVVLDYVVSLNHRELPEVERDEYEFPYVAADHGMLQTAALLILPHESSSSARRISFELPDGWDVITPWPAHAAGGFAPASDQALGSDLVAVGAWRSRTLRVGEFEAVLAVNPGQSELLEIVAEPLERIVRAELELFGGQPRGRYLFVFGRPDTPGFGGSPKTGSMTLSVDPAAMSVAAQYVRHLVAHEFFHTWSQARAPLPDELRWVNEGVTDYFAYLVPSRVGLGTAQEFRDELMKKLVELERNAARAELSLAQAGGEVFFEGGDAYALVYSGGLVLGAYLDAGLRAAGEGRSLEGFLREFLNDERWGEESARPTAADFFGGLAGYADEQLARRVRQLASAPLGADLVALFAEVGVELERELVAPVLDLRANLDGTTITAIDPAGLGFEVGLRNGDRLIEVNGRTVENAAEVHRQWRAVEAGRVRVRLEREGAEVELEEELRESVCYALVRGPW